MNFGRAFTYVSEDPEWIKKVVIAALVILIPVVGALALAGWALEITRRVINDDPQPLPAWDNFGGYIMNGLKEVVVAIVYMLPAILIYCCGFATIFGLTAVAGGSSDSSGNAGGAIASVVLLVTTCMYCFLALLIIIGALLIAPATGTLAATGELSAAFRFGEILGLLRAAIGPYLLSMLVLALAASVLGPLGSVACGVGALVAAAYIRAVGGHLYGQAYKIAKAAQNAAPMASTM